MKFPVDVTGSGATKSNLYRNSRGLIAYGILAVLLASSIIFLGPIMAVQLKVPFPVWVIANIIFFLFVGVQLYRFVIFEETKKYAEKRQGLTNDISVYWFIRKDSATTVKSRIFPFEYTVLEKTDGTCFFTLQIKHGVVNKRIAYSNKEFLTQLYRHLFQNNLLVQEVLTIEPYFRDGFFDRMANRINEYPKKRFVSLMLEIYDYIKEMAKTKSNIPTTYLYISTINISQRYSMDRIIDGVMALCFNFSNFSQQANLHDFREIKVLTEEEVRNSLKDYYQLDVLDPLRIRYVESLEGENLGLTMIAEIETEEGEVHVINELPIKVSTRVKQGSALEEKVGEEVSEEINLEEVASDLADLQRTKKQRESEFSKLYGGHDEIDIA